MYIVSLSSISNYSVIALLEGTLMRMASEEKGKSGQRSAHSVSHGSSNTQFKDPKRLKTDYGAETATNQFNTIAIARKDNTTDDPVLLNCTEIWVDSILPFVGAGHFLIVAGVNKRLK